MSLVAEKLKELSEELAEEFSINEMERYPSALDVAIEKEMRKYEIRQGDIRFEDVEVDKGEIRTIKVSIPHDLFSLSTFLELFNYVVKIFDQLGGNEKKLLWIDKLLFTYIDTQPYLLPQFRTRKERGELGIRGEDVYLHLIFSDRMYVLYSPQAAKYVDRMAKFLGVKTEPFFMEKVE